MGGVCFLDEAYSLGSKDSKDSFAKEAIDMINVYLSERKIEFMFIIAGYEEELEKCFFAVNNGLRRRFSHYICIEKYNHEELSKIFINKMTAKKYEFENNMSELSDFFKKYHTRFTNSAGDIENLCTFVSQTQSLRCFKQSMRVTNKQIIILADLENSIAKFKETSVTNIPHPEMYI